MKNVLNFCLALFLYSFCSGEYAQNSLNRVARETPNFEPTPIYKEDVPPVKVENKKDDSVLKNEACTETNANSSATNFEVVGSSVASDYKLTTETWLGTRRDGMGEKSDEPQGVKNDRSQPAGSLNSERKSGGARKKGKGKSRMKYRVSEGSKPAIDGVSVSSHLYSRVETDGPSAIGAENAVASEDPRVTSSGKSEDPRVTSSGKSEDPRVTISGKSEDLRVTSSGKSEDQRVTNNGKSEDPRVTSSGKIEDPRVTSSGKSEDPRVTISGKSEDLRVKSSGKSEDQRVTNSGKSEDPRVTSSGKIEDPRVTSSGKSEDPRVTISGKSEDLRVTSSGKSEDQRVTNNGKSEDPRVTSSGKSEDPRVTSSGKIEDPRVTSSGKIEDPRVTSSEKSEDPNLIHDAKSEESRLSYATKNEERRDRDSSLRAYTRQLFQGQEKLYFEIQIPKSDSDGDLNHGSEILKADSRNEYLDSSGGVLKPGRVKGGGKGGNKGKNQGKKRGNRKKDSKRKKSVILPNGLFQNWESSAASPASPVQEGRKNRRRMQNRDSVVASSLAFVFDSTGSMWDDLAQVKQGAVKILETIRERNTTLIADYILVPFQDPKVGPLSVSNDHEEFLRRLQEIQVFSGGDCPEMTLSAIILALQACRPHSFVYVFTDARSKDYERVNELLPLIQRKQTQVVFVMTGDCGDPQHPGYQVFGKIAATSSGQVYHLNKTDVQEVLNFVRVSLQSHKVNLLAVDRSNKNSSSTEEHELAVDQTLKEFTVSVAGIHPKVQVTDPSGESPKNLTSLLDLENVKIINVKQPDPGIWKVNVKSDAQYTIRSTGLSNIDFSYGFSVKPAKALIETSHRPLKGTENSILIQTEPRNIQNLTMVCFLSVNGEILQNVTLEPLTPKKGVYSSEPFTPTGDYFYVSINGFSKGGTPLQRITPTAISPQLPAVPEIQPPSNYTGLVHQEIMLKCHVESLVPFSVRWFKDNKAIGKSILYPQTAEAEWKLTDIKSEDEGVYTCRANNAAGYAMQRIHLAVTGNPPFVKTTEHVVTTPDRPTALECKVESPMTYNVTWFQGITGETRYWKEIKPNSKFAIGNHNELIINPTFETDAGWYQCVAQNSAGSGIGKLYLSVKEEPKIIIEPESVKVTQNGSFMLKCTITRGTPKPKLLWRKDDLPISDGWRDKYWLEQTDSASTLRVNYARSSDSGFYTCHAVNDVNIITGQVFVEYVETPSVHIEESYLLAKEGDFARMKCQASGYPHPEVSWLKNGNPVGKSPNLIQIKDDLSILSVHSSDSGVYTCVAQNSEGSHSGAVTLQVGIPPQTIENNIENTVSTVDVGKDIEFHCIVNGSPDPSIVWSREGNPSFLESKRFQVSNDSVVLKIIETSLEDEGHYFCEAENIFGKTKLEFVLKITGTEAPKFEDASETENVLQIAPGEKVHLSCTLLGGKPKPSILWYHNEFPINVEHSRYQQHENGSLTISKIEKFDGGTYVCHASNPVGSVKKVFKLQTYEPPKFEENAPSWFHVLAGDNVTIPCKVISDPKGAITWQKDGRALNTDGRLSIQEDDLIIQQVRIEDKGTYVCTVVNPAGSASRAVALDVSVKPVIIDNHGTNITLLEGEDYKIPCSAIGTPNPDIKWRRLDTSFSAGYHDEELFVLADNSLILNSVTPKMSGNYECFAQNKAGSASRVYVLTVNEPETIREEKNVDIPVIEMEVLESDVAVLECPLPSSSPPEWLKDGTELKNLHSERADEAHFALMDHQRIVRISESRASDSGDYTCNVENNDLNPHKAIVRLNVVAPPTFEQEIHEPDVSIVEGEKLVLSCLIRGNPQPKVQWRFVSKDTPITEYTFPGVYFEQLYKQNLVIQRSNHSRHNGTYQCSATNKLGSQIRDFNVKVIRPPEIKESAVVENITVNSESSVSLKCSVSSDPKPDVTWLLNGTSITPRPKTVLEKLDNDFNTYFYATNVTETGTGRYTCFASNKAGVAEKNFIVSLS